MEEFPPRNNERDKRNYVETPQAQELKAYFDELTKKNNLTEQLPLPEVGALTHEIMQEAIIVDRAHLLAKYPALKDITEAKKFKQDLNTYIAYINQQWGQNIPLPKQEATIGETTWKMYRTARRYIYAQQWKKEHLEPKDSEETPPDPYLLKSFPKDTVRRVDSLRIKAPILEGAQCAKWVRLYAQKLGVKEEDYRELVQWIDARDQVRALDTAGRLQGFPWSWLLEDAKTPELLARYIELLKSALYERFTKEPPSDDLRSVCIPLYSDSNITPSTDGWHVWLVYINMQGDLEVSDYTCPPEVHKNGKQNWPIALETYVKYMVTQRRQSSFHEGNFLLPDTPLYLKVKSPLAQKTPTNPPQNS